MTVLITPGHHEVTDTLIMFGLVEALKSHDPFAEVRVIPSGDRYQILTDIDEKEIPFILEEFGKKCYVANLYLHEASQIDKLPSVMKLHMLQRGNENRQQENISDSFRFLQELSKEIIKFEKNNLIRKLIYIDESHRFLESKRGTDVLCGKRKKSGKFPLVVANLPIAPFGGTLQGVGSYCLCKLCVSLAWIGLYYYSSRIVLSSRDSQQTFVHIFRPESESTGEIILMLKNISQINLLRQKLFENPNLSLPTAAIPLLLLCFGETSAAISEVNLRSIVYSFTNERKMSWRTAIRNIATYQINPLIKFVEYSKIYSDKLLRLVNALISTPDGILTLSTLSQAIIFQNNDQLYSAFREIRKILSNNNRENLLDRGIIKAAFESIA